MLLFIHVLLALFQAGGAWGENDISGIRFFDHKTGFGPFKRPSPQGQREHDEVVKDGRKHLRKLRESSYQPKQNNPAEEDVDTGRLYIRTHNEDGSMIDAICIEFGGCIHKYPLWGMVSVFGKISDAQSILQRTQAFAPSLIAEVRTVPFIRRNTSQPLDSATNAQTPVLKLQPLGRPAPPLWHLDRIDSYTHAFDQNYTVPRSSNGTGVHIYIIDDGAAPGEPAYAEGLFIGAKTRLVEALDFTSNAELLVTRTPLPDDYQVGHGAHVMGSAGGIDYGVAPGAFLHSYKVLGLYGGTDDDITYGLYRVYVAALTGDPHTRHIASLSLGGTRLGGPELYEYFIDLLGTVGVPVVVAGGNDNLGSCVSSPSGSVNAITVGAMDPTGTKASFSDFGNCIDIWAPGVNIESVWHGTPGYAWAISGTSMATPIVTGATAVLLQANPTLTARAVEHVLQQTASPSLKISSLYNDIAPSPNRVLFVPPLARGVVDVSDNFHKLTTANGVTSGKISFMLRAQPQANVMVRLRVSQPIATLSLTSRTFTPSNWNVAVDVTITMNKDAPPGNTFFLELYTDAANPETDGPYDTFYAVELLDPRMEAPYTPDNAIPVPSANFTFTRSWASINASEMGTSCLEPAFVYNITTQLVTFALDPAVLCPGQDTCDLSIDTCDSRGNAFVYIQELGIDLSEFGVATAEGPGTSGPVVDGAPLYADTPADSPAAFNPYYRLDGKQQCPLFNLAARGDPVLLDTSDECRANTLLPFRMAARLEAGKKYTLYVVNLDDIIFGPRLGRGYGDFTLRIRPMTFAYFGFSVDQLKSEEVIQNVCADGFNQTFEINGTVGGRGRITIENYQPSESCSFIINAPDGAETNLLITTDMEYDPTCQHDHLDIFAPSSKPWNSFSSFCGFKIGVPISGILGSTLVLFSADATIELRGAVVEWEIVPSPQPQDQVYSCYESGPREMTVVGLDINQTAYLSAIAPVSELYCVWNIDVPSGIEYLLSSDAFDFSYGDYLVIYDGAGDIVSVTNGPQGGFLALLSSRNGPYRTVLSTDAYEYPFYGFALTEGFALQVEALAAGTTILPGDGRPVPQVCPGPRLLLGGVEFTCGVVNTIPTPGPFGYDNAVAAFLIPGPGRGSIDDIDDCTLQIYAKPGFAVGFDFTCVAIDSTLDQLIVESDDGYYATLTDIFNAATLVSSGPIGTYMRVTYIKNPRGLNYGDRVSRWFFEILVRAYPLPAAPLPIPDQIPNLPRAQCDIPELITRRMAESGGNPAAFYDCATVGKGSTIKATAAGPIWVSQQAHADPVTCDLSVTAPSGFTLAVTVECADVRYKYDALTMTDEFGAAFNLSGFRVNDQFLNKGRKLQFSYASDRSINGSAFPGFAAKFNNTGLGNSGFLLRFDVLPVQSNFTTEAVPMSNINCAARYPRPSYTGSVSICTSVLDTIYTQPVPTSIQPTSVDQTGFLITQPLFSQVCEWVLESPDPDYEFEVDVLCFDALPAELSQQSFSVDTLIVGQIGYLQYLFKDITPLTFPGLGSVTRVVAEHMSQVSNAVASTGAVLEWRLTRKDPSQGAYCSRTDFAVQSKATVFQCNYAQPNITFDAKKPGTVVFYGRGYGTGNPCTLTINARRKLLKIRTASILCLDTEFNRDFITLQSGSVNETQTGQMRAFALNSGQALDTESATISITSDNSVGGDFAVSIEVGYTMDEL